MQSLLGQKKYPTKLTIFYHIHLLKFGLIAQDHVGLGCKTSNAICQAIKKYKRIDLNIY